MMLPETVLYESRILWVLLKTISSCVLVLHQAPGGTGGSGGGWSGVLLVTSVLFQHAEESPWSFFKVTSIRYPERVRTGVGSNMDHMLKPSPFPTFLNDVDDEMFLSLPLVPFSPVQEWCPRTVPWLDSRP